MRIETNAIVGAGIARPPEIVRNFRVSYRETTFYHLRFLCFAPQNHRTTDGRPYIAFYRKLQFIFLIM